MYPLALGMNTVQDEPTTWHHSGLCLACLPIYYAIKIGMLQVPDEDLVDRVAGRRLDPETGDIYHLKHKPPPEDVKDRLIQRSDDTAEKVKTRLQSHHSNVDAVLDYYQDVLVEVEIKVFFYHACAKPGQVVLFCWPLASI